jgi:hypothetical protein
MYKEELDNLINRIYKRTYSSYKYEEDKIIYVPYIEPRPLLSYERVQTFKSGAIVYNLSKDAVWDFMENGYLPQGNYLIL